MLRDMGLSSSRLSATDDRASELMRLSADPLLLHGYLVREQRDVAPPPPALKIPELPRPDGDAMPRRSSRTAYEAREPRTSTSLHPETFAPTDEDRELAVDGTEPFSAPRRPDLKAGPAFLLAVMAAMLLACVLLTL